jgi:hypothetical protein
MVSCEKLSFNCGIPKVDMGTKHVNIRNAESWSFFFKETKASIAFETADAWISRKTDVSIHLKRLVDLMLDALRTMGATVNCRLTELGMDFAQRNLMKDAFLFSHHSVGHGECIVRFKHTYISGYFQLDPNGYAGYSRLALTPELLNSAWKIPEETATSYLMAMRKKKLVNNYSKYQQPPITETSLPARYILLALQVPHDTVMRLAFDDPFEFYSQIIEGTRSLGIHCVVKRHPRCKSALMDAFIDSLRSQEHVLISNLSVNQLIPGADRVAVVNSGVGFESLLLGRPTITFAPTEYGVLAREVRSLAEVMPALEETIVRDELRIAQFARFFLEECCINSHSEESVLRQVQNALAVLPQKYGWSVEG